MVRITNNCINIASWNCCLGLFHKKDRISDILRDNGIHILMLQETEITSDMGYTPFAIKNYSFEPEKSTEMARIACYISTSINYQRRLDLEQENNHVMIIDILTEKRLRIFNIYRSFKKQENRTSREIFRSQLELIKQHSTSCMIIVGDFNLDENKIYTENYAFKHHFRDLEECWQELNLTQLVKFNTWSRTVNNQIRSSRLDHLYTNNPFIVAQPSGITTYMGDHTMIMSEVNIKSKQSNKIITYRDWRQYNQEKLLDLLRKTEFTMDISPVQDLYNHIERKIVEIADEIAPEKTMTVNGKYKTPYQKSLINRKRKFIKKEEHRKL